MVIFNWFMEYYDSLVRLLAGKQESGNAGMLKDCGTFELPSYPASQLQAY
jgi:hypothetical protein